MMIATVLCWTSWIFVIINVDPFEAGALSFSFFYISIFFALVGTLSLIIFGIYSLFSKTGEPLFRYVQNSFRDGVVISTVLTALLYLLGKNLLNSWNMIVFIAAIVSLSVFLFFNKKVSHI